MLARTIGRTVAVVAAGRVQAAALQAGRGRAVILGLLAERARVAQRADTVESADHVDALAAIATRRIGALIDIRLAVASGVAGGTGAAIVVHQIDAASAVLALTNTIVEVLRAGGSTPALQAEAREGAGQIEAFVCIDAGSVDAWAAGRVAGGCHSAGQRGKQRGRAAQIAGYDGTGGGGQQRCGGQCGCIGCLAFVHIQLADIAAPLGRALAAKAAD